jgi:hypothetical protein
MVRIAVSAALLGAVAVAAQQPAAPQKPAPEKKAETPPNPLDDLIAQALRNNPDILVAEAKVREAEAELQRTRVATAQKVASLQAAIVIAGKVRDEAEQRYRTLHELYTRAKGTTSVEDMRAAKLAWERAIYEYVKLEGEMPALLGKMPGKLGQQKAEVDAGSRDDLAASLALRWLAVQRGVQLGERVDTAARLLVAGRLEEIKAGPEGSIADRMRKALDKTIDIKIENKSLKDVLDQIAEQADKGISFRLAPLRGDGPHAKVSLQFSKTPVGAVLQALSDDLPDTAFVVRDYGILVCDEKNLPPDAVLLHRFWRSGGAESDVKNPPADGEIRGEVTEIDEKSDLVRMSIIGADWGLAKGHTLEVYREGPKPLYLGTVRILDVAKTKAVGKPIGKLHEPIKKGDKVTSKLTDK